MKKIRITGIGVVNRAGITSEELWQSLCNGKCLREEEMISFKPNVPAGRLRRMNRYGKLALHASVEAWKEGIYAEQTDVFRRGTIFTSGYGTAQSQLDFLRTVVKEDPDCCSPTVFTGIVPNSCVGAVCMFLKCKGVSTSLSGGNHLEYASILMKDEKADVILAGAVEEYCPEIFQSLKEEFLAGKCDLAEASVVLLLEKATATEGYCSLEKTGCIGLNGFPLMYPIEKESIKRQMCSLLEDYKDEDLDIIFTSANGTELDSIETEIMEELFPGVVLCKNVKNIVGETMGSGFSMNVAVASLCIKKEMVPDKMIPQEKCDCIEKVLVTGFDVMGNYLCALLYK